MPTFGYTPGGNAYPLNSSTYDQSEFWKQVALGRDVIDQQTKNDAITAAEDKVDDELTNQGVLRVRGTLPPEITSLDELNSRSWNGLWHVPAAHGVTDVPADLGNGAALVEVLIGNSATASVQRVTVGAQSYWREANFAGGSVSSWFSWRKIVHQEELESAITDVMRARGVLPEGTDLDALVLRADAGIYSLNSTYQYLNLPEEITSGAVFEMIHSGSPTGAANLQRVTHGGSGKNFFYWRESISGSSGWGPWNRVAQGAGDLDGVISSPSVKRIVVSADPQAPLEEGDLLFVPGA